jgi:glycosyltransferase involved in cell wall biosynthesis
MNKIVSVVIPTKNIVEFLEEVLLDIKKQDYPFKEVIVVDNYSSDLTREIAKEYAHKIYITGPERVAQANYSIAKAKGDYIYLTGSDMTRDKDFISQCMKKMDEGYDAVYMSVLTDKRVHHFWGTVKALERESYIGTFIESARFFNKRAWEILGRFDEDIISMEEDFQHRLDSNGFKTAWIEAREYHLHEDDSLWKIFKKAYYYGGYFRSYLKKHKARGRKQINPIRPNLKMFTLHPKLLMGFVVYKGVQYACGFLGLLFGRINGNKK